MSNRQPLYPDPLDEAYQFYIQPEADRPYPFIYRFIIRDVDSGKAIPYDETTLHWSQYPSVINPDYTDGERVLSTDNEYSVEINVKRLLEKAGKTGGVFLVSAHIVEQTDPDERLLEREQSQYMIVIDNGLKPPSLP